MKYHVYVKDTYIGTVDCTEDELRASLVYVGVTGSRVNVWAEPPAPKKQTKQKGYSHDI